MLSVFKSNIFKGFLFVVFMVCDGMSGVLVGKSITFSSPSGRNKFLNMTQNRLENVTDINFEGQEVDKKFYTKWYDLKLNKEINKLSFKNCQFSGDGFCILSGLSVKHLILDDCRVSGGDLDVIFLVNRYVIESIDLSNNNLGANKELFYDNLKKYIFNVCNPKFILKGNNFTEDDQRMIKTWNKDYCSSVEFNF